MTIELTFSKNQLSLKFSKTQRAAKEVSLKLRKPPSTRRGDLVPLGALSFRKLRKRPRAENRGFLVPLDIMIVNVFCDTVVYAQFDGFWIFGV